MTAPHFTDGLDAPLVPELILSEAERAEYIASQPKPNDWNGGHKQPDFSKYPEPPDRFHMELPSRPVIAKAQWRITIQLEVDGEKRGDPLVLRFSDTYLSGRKSTTKETKGTIGVPQDAGDIISHAIYERALALRKKPRAKK